MKDIFHRVSTKVSAAAGSAGTFLLAVMVVVVWAIPGPLFKFSNTWQLVINTGTTIVTFLMVFLIQNTQNRDSKAMQLKLDELIRTAKTARDSFMDLEDLSDEELAAIDEEFRRIHEQQSPNPALHKLHHKISAEHRRRLSLTDAEHAVKSLLNSHEK